MIEIPGFRVVEKIGGNGEISVYRLLRLEDNLKIIAKTTCENYAGSNMIAAFQYEYEQLLRLKGRGVLEPHSLELVADRPVLLLHDPGGTTLEQAMRTRRASLRFPELLGAAIAMADCIRHIHHANIRLHEITPFHILINDTYTEVKVIDIRLCSTEKDPNPFSQPAGRPDSVLPYLSPEQTGRTGRGPDYRSDFYSFGVILYEWFAGSLPFQLQNALDMVYHHLAATPDPVYTRNQSVPKVVSDIVGKCMEKMPEARYASAYGIKADLEECLVQYRVSGKVQPFPLANHDISERLLLSEGFIGKEAEQLILLQSLKRVSEGAAEAVWVGGEAGVGKTSFVVETIRDSIPAKGFFTVCQFDFIATALPYAVWRQAIAELADHLLTLHQAQVEEWKLRILDAVQGCGRLLIEMAPRLELLIGEQPAVAVLPAVEAQNRFHLVMNRFFQLFVQSEQSLVLFFDNLQWADEASIQYLCHLLGDRGTKRLLVIGAYRDNGTAPEHPLRELVNKLEDTGTRMERIRLTACNFEELKHMLRSMLQGQIDGIDELADVLLRKTGGNPLFLKQFLQEIVDRNLGSFDERSRTWQWNVQLIAEWNVSVNAAASISNSLQKLPEQTVYILGRAAFLGKQFSLHTLSLITGLEKDQLFGSVEIAVDNRLLLPSYEDRTSYIFQHDYIQQSAYELVPETERTKLHIEFGFLLAQRMRAGEDVPVFEVVGHLNQAAAQVDSLEKKLELAELNVQAGVKAKQSNAFRTSLDYLRHATGLLEDDCWDSCYPLAYQAYKERAEAEFLNADYAAADDTFNLVLRKAADFDKAQACIMMIQLEMNRNNFPKVLSLSEMTLKLLGMKHNFNPGPLEMLLQWTRVRRKLRKHPVHSFANLPPMTDERRKAALAVMVHSTNASFTLEKKVWLSSILMMLEMTMDYGMTPEASIGFVSYAMIQHYQFHDYEAAYKWGQLALATAKNNPGLYAQTYSAFSLCYDGWRRYEPGFLLAYTDHTGKTALQSGALWHANHSVLTNCSLLFQFGHPLKDIYTRLLSQSDAFKQNENVLYWKQAVILGNLLTALTGNRAPDDRLSGTNIDAKAFMEDVTGDAKRYYLQGLVNINQYITGYLLGDYRKARLALEHTMNMVNLRTTQIIDSSSYYYYEVLVLKEIYEAGSKREKASYWNRIRRSLKNLKPMARRSPENYMHKYLLVRAEHARLGGKGHEAERFYEEALHAARTRGHVHDVGIISECFAKHFINSGRPPLARLYLTEAYEAYMSWGALAKTADMEAKYGHLLQPKREAKTDLERIDYFSVAMSAQTLSGEMEMGSLLHMLMRIMLQNAGAEYGALIFDHEDRWMVEAYGTAEKLHIESIPLEEAERLLPAAIIGYTIRTKEEVVLHDVAGNSMFQRNEYIKNNRLKSALCLPIMHQNKLICLLYLENNLSTGVFTEERLDILKLLSSQCAISITNAKLYSGIQYLKNNLEDQVMERTRALQRSMDATSEALAETMVYAERNRIAQEIHDIVGHTLTSTIVQIEAGKRLLQKDAEGAVTRFKEAQDLVRHSLSEIRNSVHMLKEDKYYDITEALQQLIQDTERNTGVLIHAEMDPISHLSLIQKKVIYHALQEGLTNGIRHGGCNTFSFSLRNDGSLIQFILADNGRGASNLEPGFGLKMMRDRVQQLKGTLYVDAEPDKGCLLRISLPC
ncbi:AAA family ATPase [Paenibacillus contaminans]|uniref:Histidine kinase n=1 Tax=Paenibacillus contaminans TaxID=450362 RepID=A0A329MJ36_9BACL|nr:AAA family ATPase [Paenibacillus contaminans]RAV19366.1 histidine kinase [Paenibacillus contaminans]